ncbi:MAG: redoxin domain-containing protein [Planctomycetes bacterium]|nr:redoxin domain-containing protein [Planctomycetota bacterium]
MAPAPSSAVLTLLLASSLGAQSRDLPVDPDAAFRQMHAAWQAKHRAFVDAMRAARQSGKLPKGGVPPADVQQAERAAIAARDAVVAAFGKRDDLHAASYLLFANMHERHRDYASAVRAYEHSLRRGDPEAPNLRTLGSLCLAALNSKDDTLAAKWMRTTIEQEDRRGGAQRNLAVRTSYYPRTLISLGDWKALERHLAALAGDSAPRCRQAAATFGVVAALHRGELAAAKKKLAAIRAAPSEFPDHQGWAVLAQFALDVHDGAFDRGAASVRAFLESPASNGSAIERNTRRYLAAVAPFLGKPAPGLRADHSVGGELTGRDVLPGLRGKVVVLDFWQPWCEPCRKAMPEMVAAQARYAGAVQVLGVCKVENYGYDVSAKKAVRPIAAAEYPGHVADFRKDMALTYPLLVCDTAQNSRAYKIAGVPTLVIVDRQGVVRYMSCGAGEPGLFRIALEGVVGKQSGTRGAVVR